MTFVLCCAVVCCSCGGGIVAVDRCSVAVMSTAVESNTAADGAGVYARDTSEVSAIANECHACSHGIDCIGPHDPISRQILCG
jgi:hypothetical protein